MSLCFNPLYRGTWFPTNIATRLIVTQTVSIRYIAVLGFQQGLCRTRRRLPSSVSIRYIAVLGFQLLRRKFLSFVKKQVSIRYIAVLGFQQRR